MLRQHARSSRLPRSFHAPHQAVSEAIAIESTRLFRARTSAGGSHLRLSCDSTQANTPPQHALVCLAGHPQVCPGQRRLVQLRWNRPRPSYWQTQAAGRHPAPSWLGPSPTPHGSLQTCPATTHQQHSCTNKHGVSTTVQQTFDSGLTSRHVCLRSISPRCYAGQPGDTEQGEQ
jgi:hypothetical protein